MAGINLLPQELKPKTFAFGISKTLKKFALLSLIVFFGLVFLYVGANTVYSLQLKLLRGNEDKLKKQIQDLEQTEQKLILVEDRLEKMGTILAANDANGEAGTVKSVLDKNHQNIGIPVVKLDGDKAMITISTGYSGNLTGFFSGLMNMNFKQIELTSFNYEKDKGYRVEVAISK